MHALRDLRAPSSVRPLLFYQLFPGSLLSMTTQMGTTLQQFAPSMAEDDNMDIDIDIDMDADVEPIPEPELEVRLSTSSHHDCAPFSQLHHRKEKNTRRLRSARQYLRLLFPPSILRTQNKRFNRPKFTSEASTTSPPMMFETSQLPTT